MHKAGIAQLFFGSYPITPASSLLHILAGLRPLGVVTFQAEDEIAAICSAIGASWAGALGVTSSSGPGLALKGEALGLAILTELPLVVVNSQRAGPSTGMPTKSEQGDLLQAVHSAHGYIPHIVLAAGDVEECYTLAFEAFDLADKYQCPVFLLSDLALADGRRNLPEEFFTRNRRPVVRHGLLRESDFGEDHYYRYRITVPLPEGHEGHRRGARQEPEALGSADE